MRKNWSRSVRGVVGGQADVVMCISRMWWSRFRMRDCVDQSRSSRGQIYVGVEVEVAEVFVEVGAAGGVSGGGGECEHEIGDGMRPRVQDPEVTCIQAELCDEEGMIGKDWNANDVGEESGDDVVVYCGEWIIPVCPVGGWTPDVVVVEDIATQ